MLNKDGWNQLCSAMDILCDTELALISYEKTEMSRDDFGANFLTVFGALQILYVQQDALRDLAAALNITLKRDEELKVIREIRNSSVGHPTKQTRRKGQQQSSFIVQRSVSNRGFQLMTFNSGSERPMIKHVGIPVLITTQRNILCELLEKVSDKLRNDEMTHRAKYRESKLTDLFPQNLSYHYEKITEQIHGDHEFGMGIVGIERIIDFSHKLKQALDERESLRANDFLRYRFEELDYPINELRAYLDSEKSSKLNDKDADIFLFYIRKSFDELYEVVQEIDSKYEQVM